MEADGFEGDGALDRHRQRDRVGRCCDFRLGRHQVEQPFGGSRCPLKIADDLADAADRSRHDDGIEHEGAEIAGGEPAGKHVMAADPKDRADCGEHQDDDNHGQGGAGPYALDRDVERVFDPVGEIAAFRASCP